MAQTRAERTHGRWPVWLPLLALAAAGLWLFSLSWNRVRPGANMAPPTVPQTIYQQRITDLLTITTAPEKRVLSGTAGPVGTRAGGRAGRRRGVLDWAGGGREAAGGAQGAEIYLQATAITPMERQRSE